MKKLLISAMAALFLAGCGSTSLPELSLVEETEITSESTLQSLLVKGITVNIGNVINGQWNVTDFAISEVNVQPVAASSQNKKEIHFSNGDMDNLSVPPLFDYHEVVSQGFTQPAQGMICSAMPVGETYITDEDDSFEYFNANFIYNIIDTGYEPIIQFILTGTQYTACATTGSDCSNNPECYTSEFRTKVVGYVIRGTDNNAFVIETPKHYVLFEREANL